MEMDFRGPNPDAPYLSQGVESGPVGKIAGDTVWELIEWNVLWAIEEALRTKINRMKERK